MTAGRRRSKLLPLRGDAPVQKFLEALAGVLLARGMTPRRFGELARFAFVRAATERARLRNGRVNQSRVAAQTGLSRADVKRLLLQSAAQQANRLAQAPVERVLDGWRADRQFSGPPGRPRRLRLSGAGPSFVGLVKKYGGDVPHRAVLDELRRIDAVGDDGVSVWLKRSRTLSRRNDYGFLSPVLPVFLDGIGIASQRQSSRSPSSIYRLTLPLENEMDLAIVRERSASSAKSMLEGLGDSLGSSFTVPRRRGRSTCSLTITVMLAESRKTKGQRW
jgi:Family of unknown function (DUF6502)